MIMLKKNFSGRNLKMSNNPVSYPKYLNRSKRMDSVKGFHWKEFFTIANMATLAFCIVDFAFMFTKWNAAYTASVFILILITAATATVLDLPMMIAGKAIKKMQRGLLDKQAGIITVSLSVTAFLIAFGFSVWFAIETKELVFSSLSSNMTITGAGADIYVPAVDDSGAILSAAWLSAVLPFASSLASLVVTLFTYDPVEEKLAKIRRARFKAEEHLRHIEQGIAEAETLGSRIDIAMAAAQAKYAEMVERVWIMRDIRRQAYRQALMDNSPDNDNINHIIDNSYEISVSRDFDTEPVTHISDILEKEPADVKPANPTEPASGTVVHRTA